MFAGSSSEEEKFYENDIKEEKNLNDSDLASDKKSEKLAFVPKLDEDSDEVDFLRKVFLHLMKRLEQKI